MKTKIILIILSISGYWVNAQNETVNGNLDVTGLINGGFGAKTGSGVLDWNDISNTKSGNGYTLLRASHLNGPNVSSTYFHPFNFEYASKNGRGNVTQFAIPYGYSTGINEGLWMRGRYSNNWTSWVKILSENLEGNVGIGGQNPLGKLTIRDGAQVLNILTNKKLTGSWPAVEEARTMTIQSTGSAVGNIAFATGNQERMRVLSNGNVGIGTTNPQEKFQIGNSYAFHDGGHKVIGFLHKPSGGIDLDNTKYSAEIRFDPTNGNFGLGTSSTVTSAPTAHFNIDKNGKVGIGTIITGNHKLAVEGSIGAREIKVEINGWSDFVFDNDYLLPTLTEVETHIKEKGHLKDIPSAKEVEQNGIFLGEMDSKLLQKIEELTLYTINQEKRIENLEVKNEKLIKLLETLIDKK